MQWGVLVMIVAAGLGCAHSRPADCHSERAVTGDDVIAAPADALMTKFDPALRWSLQDKTAGEHTVLAELSAPISQADREQLENSGLRILTADQGRLHARGDAQALLHLATFPQVVRIQGSRRMRPQTED